MKKLSLILIGLEFVFVSNGQFETDYTPIKSSGDIPSEFTTLASVKYSAQKVDINANRFERKSID